MSQTAVIGHAAESFVIEGGQALHGRIQAAGNKNGALPILAACLLTSEPVELRNVPRIADVQTMIDLLNDLGADAEGTGANDVRVHAADLAKQELDDELASRMRASFLLAGPLLARLGAVSVPPPGGDVIGRRRLDPHIHAFAELGAHIDIGRRFEMRGGSLRGKDVFLDEASVMATENAVMVAALTPGERVIGPDHIEVGSFIGLAAITGSDVTIDGVKQADLVSILHAFEKLGVHVEPGDGFVRVPPRQELVVRDDLGGHVPKIGDA